MAGMALKGTAVQKIQISDGMYISPQRGFQEETL